MAEETYADFQAKKDRLRQYLLEQCKGVMCYGSAVAVLLIWKQPIHPKLAQSALEEIEEDSLALQSGRAEAVNTLSRLAQE